jgi:hypothetical protein
MGANTKIESTEPTTLAYLAGMVDADGYITVQRSTHKGRLYYGPKIGIAGTRREPHDLAASIFGGAVSCYRPKVLFHLPQFQWSRSGAAAKAAIEALFPYLRIKVDQALVALALHDHLEAGRTEDPYPWFGPGYDPTERSDELYLEAKSLNIRKPRGRNAILVGDLAGKLSGRA